MLLCPSPVPGPEQNRDRLCLVATSLPVSTQQYEEIGMVGMSDPFVSVGRLLPLLQVVQLPDTSLSEGRETGLQVEAGGVEDGVELVLPPVLGLDAVTGDPLDRLGDKVNIVFIKSLEIII